MGDFDVKDALGPSSQRSLVFGNALHSGSAYVCFRWPQFFYCGIDESFFFFSVCLSLCLHISALRPSARLFSVSLCLCHSLSICLCLSLSLSFQCACVLSAEYISPSWERDGCKNTLSLEHYPRQIKFSSN